MLQAVLDATSTAVHGGEVVLGVLFAGLVLENVLVIGSEYEALLHLASRLVAEIVTIFGQISPKDGVVVRLTAPQLLDSNEALEVLLGVIVGLAADPHTLGLWACVRKEDCEPSMFVWGAVRCS